MPAAGPVCPRRAAAHLCEQLAEPRHVSGGRAGEDAWVRAVQQRPASRLTSMPVDKLCTLVTDRHRGRAANALMAASQATVPPLQALAANGKHILCWVTSLPDHKLGPAAVGGNAKKRPACRCMPNSAASRPRHLLPHRLCGPWPACALPVLPTSALQASSVLPSHSHILVQLTAPAVPDPLPAAATLRPAHRAHRISSLSAASYGSRPCRSGSPVSAPASSSSWQTSRVHALAAAAKCSGVDPRAFSMFTSAPRSSSSRAASTEPLQPCQARVRRARRGGAASGQSCRLVALKTSLEVLASGASGHSAQSHGVFVLIAGIKTAVACRWYRWQACVAARNGKHLTTEPPHGAQSAQSAGQRDPKAAIPGMAGQ